MLSLSGRSGYSGASAARGSKKETAISRNINKSGLEPPGAYLFVDDDDDEVMRFRLDAERVRIGRDEGNDIWLDHPMVPPHAMVIYKRDGIDNIKVYEGAKVQLNGVTITGMHRLYSGDKLGVADREFLYARDDTEAEISVGVTVIVGEEAQRALVMRRTRLVVGRREGDFPLGDPTISEGHLVIECYSADGLYVHNTGGGKSVQVDGEPLVERRRLSDGSLVRLGRLTLRVRIMPVDANGLLLGITRRRSVDEIAGASRRLSAATANSRTVTGDRPSIPADARAEVPPTVVGSLAQLQDHVAPEPKAQPAKSKRARRESQAVQSAPPTPRQKQVQPNRDGRSTGPQVQRQDSWKPVPQAEPDSPVKRRKRQRQEVERVRSDLYQPGQEEILPREFPRMRPRQPEPRTYASGKKGGRNAGDQSSRKGRLPPRKQGNRRSGFHEQFTDVLRTEDVHRVVEEHYQQVGAQPDEWASLDAERYRPSKPGEAQLSPERRIGGANAGAHYDHRGQPMEFRQIDQIQLTNVLDVVGDKPRLDHDLVGLDEDAMPQQLRKRRRSAPVAPPVQGYSNHDPTKARAPSAPPQDNDWDEIDAAQRGYRKFDIDSSPRYLPDEDK